MKKLPAQLVNYMLPYLDPKSRHRFAKMTCGFYRTNTKTHMERLANPAFKEALELIIAGVPDEENKAGHMIRKIFLFKEILNANCNLEFLTKRGTVINKAKDTIEDATLLQVAWGEKDEELVEMILDRFSVLGEYDEGLRQLDRFPEEKEVKGNSELLYQNRDRAMWDPIIAAVTANDEKALQAAHEKFKEWVGPRVIKQGTHFIRKRIFEEVDAVYVRSWRNWNYDQCLLFCDYTIGFLERSKLPACYGEELCAGIDGRLTTRRRDREQGTNTPIPRSLKLKNGDDLYSANLVRRSDFYCVDLDGGGLCMGGGWLRGVVVEELDGAKAANLGRIKERFQKSKPAASCVIL